MSAVSFSGVEKQRGALLGLSTGQTLGCVLAAVIFAGGMFRAHTPAGMFLVLVVSAGAAAGALVPVGGLSASEWALRAGGAGVRRVTGEHVWISAQPFVDVDPPRQFRGVTLAEMTVRGETAGVLVDKASTRESHTAVLAVEGTSFGLAGGDERERRIRQWSTLVASLGESHVARLQVIARSLPADPEALQGFFDANRVDGADPAWAASYQAELDKVGSANVDTHLAVAVVVDHRKRGVSGEVRRLGGGRDGKLAVLAAEVDRLWDQLRAADIVVTGPLSPRQLSDAVRSTLDPFVEEIGGGMWPSAQQEQWGTVRCDSAVHAAFWVSAWPTRDVEPGAFLEPFLLRSLRAGYVRTFSLVIEPAHPDTALRKVETVRFAEELETKARTAAGFSVAARKRMSADALRRREEELVAGHTDCRFVGAVVVSAPDDAALGVGCAEVRRVAYQSHLRLTRQHGIQAGMLGVAVPLGRGFDRKALGR